MTETDKPELFLLIADVMAFYGKDTSKFSLGVWWEACKPFDMEQVRSALNAHALDPESGVYPPKPADLTRLLHGTSTDRARKAWGKLMDGMQRVGAYQTVVFDDPVIHAVVDDLGGWMKLCRSEMSDLSYTEHRFCESYRAYANRPGAMESYPSKLLGQYELENRQNGRKPAPPVLLGDPRKAEQVLNGGSADGRQRISLLGEVAGLTVVQRLESAA